MCSTAQAQTCHGHARCGNIRLDGFRTTGVAAADLCYFDTQSSRAAPKMSYPRTAAASCYTLRACTNCSMRSPIPLEPSDRTACMHSRRPRGRGAIRANPENLGDAQGFAMVSQSALRPSSTRTCGAFLSDH